MKRRALTHRKKLTPVFICIVIMGFASLTGCESAEPNTVFGGRYPGPDSAIQVIPGTLQCEYFNLGGEGTAYHDADSMNHGSGVLNQGDGYLDRFRISEGVDISYTKFHDSIDNSAYNMVETQEDQLYVGWTEPGESVNYTVNVLKSGSYRLKVMYTSRYEGQFSLEWRKSGQTDTFTVATTFNKEDPLAWRQWHHWNVANDLQLITLEKGEQTLTLHMLGKGNMNFDFLSFTLAE
jgi:hypothetical protein